MQLFVHTLEEEHNAAAAQAGSRLDAAGALEEEIFEKFTLFDTDGSGTINTSEMMEIVKTFPASRNRSEARLRKWVEDKVSRSLSLSLVFLSVCPQF